MASATLQPYAQPLDGAAVTVLVALYDRALPSGKRYTLLPNVQCERVTYREGAVPATAQFSYVLDTADPTFPFPALAQQLWPLDAMGSPAPGVVPYGKELVVFVMDSAGDIRIVFDGYADAPQIDVDGHGQTCTFTASSVHIRCWDKPVHRAYYRDADDPQAGAVVPTELPCRFNPDGHPNCTPDGYDVNEDSPTAAAYPVFLDWRIQRSPDPRTFWTLGKFARYVLANRPSGTKGDLNFVDNPKSKFLSGLDSFLQAIKPASGNTGPIDVADASTYGVEDIIIDDLNASDHPWPEVLAETLARHGFGFRFRTGQDDSTPLPEPKNDFQIYRRDGLFEPAPKDLKLQAYGTSKLDPGKTNLGALKLVRDGRGCANQFRVVTRLARYEVSVVLAPGFVILSSDAANPGQFKTSQLISATGSLRNAYRRYVADEAGDGHWDLGATPPDWTPDKPLDLSPAFGSPKVNTDPAKYVRRNRPGFDTLVAKDDKGRSYQADLSISYDYAGPPPPALWDFESSGSGTWQSLGTVGWRLLKDRLGIELTCDDPNAWKLPNPPAGTLPVVAGGVVKGVEAQAAPSNANPYFYLRLTCLVEADWGAAAVARRRVFAPGDFAVERNVDARDVYFKNLVDTSSIHSPGTTPTTWDRDDTQTALDRAYAYRDARECPTVAGSAEIPRFSLGYSVGNRIRSVAGVGIDLRANVGAVTTQSPIYPVVAGISWNFSGGRQSTTLELSDLRAEDALPRGNRGDADA